eukprot:TRINITY_DN6797_c0_g1_i1.p1 TRINITY_DN6797_c0_g1~~TRINITY_DN6797_c0_g1_i1.p1  ORF type:complete len:293 (-),score=19.61 TRINITY_DN6797_c0_g1_i1:199-1077(-)
MDATHQLPLAYHLIAGSGSGLIASAATYPLDLVKTKLQVNNRQRGTFVSTFRHVVITEGVRGLYRGLSPNLIGNGVAWGLYFYMYQNIKKQLSGPERNELGPITYMIAGMVAGITVAALTNPIWVVKTRMQTQPYGHKNSYTSFTNGMRRLWQEEGIRGFYKGWAPAFLGVTHGAVQVTVYDWMRKALSDYMLYHDGVVNMQPYHFTVMGCVSKLIASVATYPHQVLKSRLQQHPTPYTGLVDCTIKTWQQEGLRGFYGGLVPNTLRVLPAAAITFLSYEMIAAALLTFHNS